MKKVFAISASAVAGALSFFSVREIEKAQAYEAEECNGHINRGIRSQKIFRTWQCSIPPGSAKEADILYAQNEWNLAGTAKRFLLAFGPTSCGPVSHDDTQWDVAFVTSASIDGDAGKLVKTYEPCSWPYTGLLDGDLTSGDVLFNGEIGLVEGPTPENDAFGGSGVRRVALHEFGHVLGAKHEDDEMSVMCVGDPPGSHGPGLVGARTAGGGLVNHTDATMPTDVAFKVDFHNSSGAEFDIAASGYEFFPGGGATLTHPVLINRNRCPGETLSVRWSHAIKGEGAISSVAGKIVLSTNSTISTFDTTLANATIGGSRGQFFTNTSVVTIPSVAPGQYFVGFVVDSGSTLSESDEGNNSVLLNVRVFVPEPQFC